MARIKVTGVATNTDENGKLIVMPDADVGVYEDVSGDPVDTYATESAGSTSTVKTNSGGYFEFWIDFLQVQNRIKIEVTKTGYSTMTVTSYQVVIDVQDLPFKDRAKGDEFLWIADNEDNFNPKRIYVSSVPGYGFTPATELASPIGNWATDFIDNGASKWFTFYTPKQYNGLVEAVIALFSQSTNATANIDIYSSWAKVGEDRSASSDSDTTTTYDLTADEIFELDISGILTSIEGGDYVGIKLTNNAGASNGLYILGTRILIK